MMRTGWKRSLPFTPVSVFTSFISSLKRCGVNAPVSALIFAVKGRTTRSACFRGEHRRIFPVNSGVAPKSRCLFRQLLELIDRRKKQFQHSIEPIHDGVACEGDDGSHGSAVK